MSTYVDLVVTPVPEAKLDEYRRLSEMAAAMWLEHGALSYVEVQADDAKSGKLTSFPQSVDLQPGETVFVQITTYRSRAHRDEVSGKVMEDPRITGMDMTALPFDPRRMFFGGFKPFVG
jgi:uncharacterized protein YbaA (DUF1428 family)